MMATAALAETCSW